MNVFKKIVKRINPARKGRAEKLAASRERDKKSELTLDGNWKLKQTDSIAVQRNLRLDLYDVITRIKKKIGSQRKIRILDLGCLDGKAITEIANAFPNVEAHGLSLRRSSHWTKKEPVSWHVGHAEKMPLKSGYFDFVYSHFGITHAHSLSSAFKELSRIIRPGGEAVFNLEIRAHGFDPSLKKTIEKSGFEISSYAFGKADKTLIATIALHLRKK